MVEHALDYARRGWPVFPCRPTNKAPFFEGGFHVATTDEETIRKWWGYWPKAMIGVPMGSRSGVWAIDPDPPKKPEEPDGREMLAKLLAEHGELPATHTEITPRSGQHIVFKWDPDRPVTNSPGALAKTNIDVRGEGGYIVVAPSVCVGDGSEERRRAILLWPGTSSISRSPRLALRAGTGKAGAEAEARARTRAGDNEFVSAVIGEV